MKLDDKIDLWNVKERLELLRNQHPLVIRHVLSVEFLETVDGGTGDLTVEDVAFFELSAVGGLVAAHFDLDGHGGLSLFADVDLFVFTLDGCTVGLISIFSFEQNMTRGRGRGIENWSSEAGDRTKEKGRKGT